MKRRRPLVGRLSMLGLWLALLAASYLLGAGAVSAALPICAKECPCKMTMGWRQRTDNYAQGMQNQDATPAKILYGYTNIQATECPDPPAVKDDILVDRYKYQQYLDTCTDNNMFRSTTLESDVNGAGTRTLRDVTRQICVEPPPPPEEEPPPP